MTESPISVPSIEQRVAFAAQRIVFSRLLLSVVFTLVISLVFVGLLTPFFPTRVLVYWIGGIQAIGLVRLGLWFWYRNAKPEIADTYQWSRRFLVCSIAAAASWSIGAVVAMPLEGQIEVAMLCVTLLAVSSVAVSSLSAHYPSLLGFLLTCLGPLAARLLFATSGLEQVVGLALLASMVAFAWTGLQSTRVTRQLLRTELELSASVEETRAAQAVAENASKAKSRFLATMSHEVRTPLNGILGLAELLEGTPLDSGQRDFVRLLRRSGDNLREIVNDVLDFSKIEAEQMEIASVQFEPRQLAHDIVELWRERATRSQLQLQCKVAPQLPLRVCGDPLRLRQIITNFLANSFKFTQQGTVELQLGVMTDQPLKAGSRAVLRFAVRDSGVGIAPDAAARVFDAFTQVDESYSRRFGGTGLGLAICRRLTELMGGQIGVDSTPGVGSTFWIQVPLEVIAPADAATAELNPRDTDTLLGPAQTTEVQMLTSLVAPTATPVMHNEDTQPRVPAAAQSAELTGRVLMVEDNAINRAVCGAMLQRLGLEFATANDGSEAIDQATDHSFDLVLMDCQMPEVDGYAATIELRRRGIVARNGRPLPIVALTANAFDEDRDRAREAGMDAFLSKPVRLDELRDTMARWLPYKATEPTQADSSSDAA